MTDAVTSSPLTTACTSKHGLTRRVQASREAPLDGVGSEDGDGAGLSRLELRMGRRCQSRGRQRRDLPVGRRGQTREHISQVT